MKFGCSVGQKSRRYAACTTKRRTLFQCLMRRRIMIFEATLKRNIKQNLQEQDMTTGELITLVIVFVIAGVFLLFSIRSVFERGFLLNNAYLYASKEERKTMNKKPYYKQSAVVFCILSAVFLVIGLSLLLQNENIILLEIPLIVGIIIYAIVSTVMINKQAKR